MRYGDKDGFGSVYDGSGDLVLRPGERVLVTEENVIPSLKTTWRYYGGEYLLEPSKGNIYLTTERMVFINIPERVFAIGGSESRAMDGGAVSLGQVASGGSQREYFEIPNIEIMASEKREGAVTVGQMVNVYVLSAGNQYHLSMVLIQDSSLLSRLMNKQIKALDELVNNLKVFFQQTDWMYTELERNMMTRPASGNAQLEEPRPKMEDSKPRMADIAPFGGPRRRGPKLGKESVKYFENLYNKGLITKDVYDRLMGEYSTDPIPIKPIEPMAKDENEPDMSDQDLLNLLSGTLESLKEEPPMAMEVPPERSQPKRAKKVIKLAVKG